MSELLARRSDLSTFVVHFTRKTHDGKSARQNLKSILRQQTIEARTPFGSAFHLLSGRDLASQHCVSFSETPLEHLHCLTQQIPKRQVRLSSYGLAFAKMTARKRGVNPVWYVDITPGHDWLMKPINALIERQVNKVKKFRNTQLAKICPFIEQMGSGQKADGYGYQKEFWWEREWRHNGDFSFFWSEIVFGLCPGDHIAEFECMKTGGRKVRFVDPKWSLDRIIAHLAGCKTILTPFD
ncbi:MAG: abortive infection system antitoxin AbiGi family protein [Terriglobia bacterium]